MAVYSIFTVQATEEAKAKMHPKYSKSVWAETITNTGVGYKILLDASTVIYNATLN